MDSGVSVRGQVGWWELVEWPGGGGKEPGGGGRGERTAERTATMAESKRERRQETAALRVAKRTCPSPSQSGRTRLARLPRDRVSLVNSHAPVSSRTRTLAPSASTQHISIPPALSYFCTYIAHRKLSRHRARIHSVLHSSTYAPSPLRDHRTPMMSPSRPSHRRTSRPPASRLQNARAMYLSC